MSYEEDNPTKDERVIYKAHIHWIIFVPHIILMFVSVGLLTIIPAIKKQEKTELTITNKRIIGKTGFIKIKSMDSPLNKNNNVKIKQSIIGRIFNYGNIKIDSASGSYFYNKIASPVEFKIIVTEGIDSNEDKRMQKQPHKILGSMNKSCNQTLSKY